MSKKYVDENGLMQIATIVNEKLSRKVDTVSGKGLSTNDYTTAEKTKLSGIANNANNYTLPKASASVLGGIKVGKNLSIDSNGVLSATDTNTTYSNMTGATSSADGKAGLVPAPTKGNQAKYLKADGTWQTPTNTTYGVVTTSKDGLMSKGDKTKLDGIATGATKNVASTVTPKANGTAAVGSDSGFAKGDHVHPAQTTISGNAGSATKLQNSRTIGLSGAATGTATSFNGTANITIPVTSLDASKLTGTASVSTTGNAATATKATQDKNGKDITSTYKKVDGSNSCVILTGNDGNTSEVGYRLVAQKTMPKWGNTRVVLSVASRHQGTGILTLALSTSSTLESWSADFKYFGSAIQYTQDSWRAYFNSTTGVFSLFWMYGDYSVCNVSVLECKDFPTISNGEWMTTIDANTYGEEIPLQRNACTDAEKLTTARTINGTSFNGTKNITTANWGTARNIGIVNSDGTGTAVTTSVNGSGNVNLKLPATIKATLSGNSSSATKLQNAKTIALSGAVTGSTTFDGSENKTIATTLSGFDASKITSGTIDIARIPAAAIETIVVVADDTARFKLTTTQVQNGDCVKVTGTGKMYMVKDQTKLTTEAGYEEFAVGKAAIAASCTGNSATATKLQTARTINGTSFNGETNITTSNWGTARNVGIVNSDGTGTAVTTSVNGSGNVNLKLPATIKASLTGNASTATKATQDSAGQQINTTYIKGLSVNGKTITYTKGDGTTGTITTQDTNTTYGNMTGATADAAGGAGLVPAPAKGKQTSFLRGDGTWVVPTNTTYTAGTGLSLSSNKFSIKNSGVTAGSYGPTANVTGTNGSTINVPQITVDATGRVTSVVNRVLTNKDNNTTYSVATQSANGLMSSADKKKLDGMAAGVVTHGYATVNSGETLTNGYSVTLPVSYVVGTHQLELYANGERLVLKDDSTSDGHYQESGSVGATSSEITFYRTTADGDVTLTSDLVLYAVVRA